MTTLAPPLGIDERLMRAVLRWGISRGFERTSLAHVYRSADRLAEVSFSIARTPDDGWLTIYRNGEWLDFTVPVRNVRQAVDVLAAYGVVPEYFSPLYAQGRASAHVAGWEREVSRWWN